MDRKYILTNFFLICMIFNLTLCSEVPVFIWGGKTIEKLPYVSAMKNYNEKVFQNKFVNSLLNENETLIVFIQDTLSLEDFINLEGRSGRIFQYLKNSFDKEPLILLPSVTNPTESLAKLKKNYKIEQFYLNESFVNDIVAAVEKNNIILLHSSDNEELNRNDALKKLDKLMNQVEASLGKNKKSVTYMLTGYNPSWDKSSDESRITRHLLAVENEALNYTLLNFSDCGLLYTKKVSMMLTYNNTEKNGMLSNGTVTLEVSNTDCKFTNKSVEINIKVIPVEAEIKNVSLALAFNTEFGEWFLESAILSFQFREPEESEELNMTISRIDAPKKFSYSCYKTIMSVRNQSDIYGNITFEIFQIQPFKTRTDKFAESFDCVTFFTIPIWMGFMVILLLTAILAFGIYMLFNIHTMDRFDDPKGKPLSVPTAD